MSETAIPNTGIITVPITPEKEEEKKVGRPSIMTPEIVGKLIEAFEMDCTIGEACAYADIHRDTYYDWAKKHPQFSYNMQKAQERPFIKAKKILFLSMETAQDAIKFLERRQKDLYALRLENTGKNGEPLQLISDAELDRKILAAAKALGKEGIGGLIGGESAKEERKPD